MTEINAIEKGLFTKWIMGVAATALVAFSGAWIQINSRIAVLEVQVDNDHQAYLDNSQKMDEMMKNIVDIKETCVEMQGDMKMKQDKYENTQTEGMEKPN